MFYFFRLYKCFASDHCQGARKVKCSFFGSLTSLLEMPQYYYTGVSDQKLQYNKIKYQKKKKKEKEQSYFYHKTEIFNTITLMDVFIITLPISCEQPALLQYHLFFLQLNATQSTGRAMNNKGPYEKDIRVFMRVCRRMSLDTCAWYFYTMSSYLWAALCISEHFIVANVNIKSSF